MRKGDGSGWTAAQDHIVLQPYEYMVQKPGKDIRRALILAFNAWLEVPNDRLEIISKAITMLHNASLLYVLSPNGCTPRRRVVFASTNLAKQG